MAANNQVKYEIINHIGVISADSSGWQFELNRVSWNGSEPKYDIRKWAPDHARMGRGITLTEAEIISLEDLMVKEIKFLNEE